MRGFTLLEMLLATALLSVLMLGVLSVIATLGPAHAAGGIVVADTAPSAEVLDAWGRLLVEDLSQSREAQADADIVSLRGPLGIDAAGLQRTHRPARVTYRLEDLDGRRWLVRVETALDVPTNQTQRRDLVCCNVVRFTLTRVEDASGPRSAEPPAGAHMGSGVWRLQVWTDQTEQPAYDRLLAAYPGGTP